MVTIQDIAYQCGVTKMTVSRALSDNGSINLETRRKIEETAQQLRYEPNSHARRTAAKRHGKKLMTGMYAVILPPFGDNAEPLSNFFFGPILSGVENEAISRGHELVIATHCDARTRRGLSFSLPQCFRVRACSNTTKSTPEFRRTFPNRFQRRKA